MTTEPRPRTRRRPIRVVPLHPPPARAAAPAAPKLTYRGGPLLTAVQAVGVFWGAAWQQPPQATIAQQLEQFLKFVVASSYMDQLAEYSTADKKIGRGSFVASATVTDAPLSPQVTDAAIQQMLEQHVTSKALPAPGANTLYFVFLPPGVTVVSGNERSCQVFCGYHDRSSAAGLYYAVVPSPDCAGCLGGLQAIAALTSVCSHELAEAVTDPVPGTGWYDDANGEIGDICAWQNKQLGAYTVQLEWSNRTSSCM
jgi:hypothetical protein